MPEIPDESQEYIDSDPIRRAFNTEIPTWLEIPEEEPLPEFEHLREEVHVQISREVAERLSANPEPDEEELSAGAYREMIEPQCRDAVFKIRQKGHPTYSSGFGTGNRQIVSGLLMSIGIESVRELQKRGYILFRTGLTDPTIAFRPEHADLEEMKTRWDELADLLPDLGHAAEPNVDSREEFDKHVRLSGF